MVSKNQWRAISIVLAVVLLLAAFMTGLTGIADGISPVGEVRDDYASFKKELDTLSDNEKALADGKAEYDEKKAAELEEKLKKNRFSLTDYLDQMQQLRGMGDLSQLAGMMPGQLGKQMANAELDPKMMAHTEAIILSMTPYERENPAVLGASRKKRIAAGCGLEVVDVNRLLKQFDAMQQMVKQFTRGRGGLGGRMHGFGRKKRLK